MKKVTQNGTVASHERYLYRGYLQLAALDMLDNRNVLRTLLWDPLEPVATRPLALVQAASLYCYGMGLQQKRDGGLRRTGNDRGNLRLFALWDSWQHRQTSSSPSSGPARCTTKNSPWSITTTAYYNPRDGSLLQSR